MYTLRQYLTTLADPYGLTRTLGEIEVCRDEAGHMCYTAGNSAVVFRIRREGRIRSLRCYTRPARYLPQIYGERFLPQELYLYTSFENGVWVDTVLSEWIEGVTLHEAIAEAAAAGDRLRLGALAATFDRMAAELTADEWAHGDLKPENIIVDSAGKLHLIDFDAMYLPAFAGMQSPELGTAAFQHPARTVRDFDASLDDYPAALISTALHALALDPTLYERYHDGEGLLYTPQKIHTDAALREALTLFEREGLAVQYRIARLLYAPTPRLFGLAALLARAAENTPQESAAGTPSAKTGQLELFVENGLWGYRTRDRVVIPPLYDSGFDFTEGLAAVRLGSTWHYIDAAGRAQVRCPGYEAVKPFRNGRAQAVCGGRRVEISHPGAEFDI